jgi:hypothetical protein
MKEEAQGQRLSRALIALMKGIVDRQADEARWQSILDLQAPIKDHVELLGLDLMLDEAEGYAWLSSRVAEEDSPEMPRLVARRQMTYPVSLILALLCRKMVESESAGETRLILSRDEVVELVRVFLPATANEAKLLEQVDSHLNRIVEYGFARRMRGQDHLIEVKRILKSFVDAQWLSEFDRRLEEYRDPAGTDPAGKEDPA